MLTVKVLLAEDVPMVRGALVALLELERDLRVIAEVASGDEIVPEALRTHPDVAVIDVDLPGVDGIDAAIDLRRHLPRCRTLLLTSMGRPGTLRRALNAQVNGFLLKDAPSDQLASAVRAVASGQRVLDPQLAMTAWDTPEVPLSARELEVLRLAARGAEAAEIAACLYLSKGTVRNYLSAIVTKLHARNRVDAVRIAQEAGWIA
ncbi:response regulator transcription factor [Streptomyces sp. ACA25]|uniref:response regulator transcription factor n=1 Tax=Streptomyces sp. ACA25 TaxID=3022596 RepID=UPI002307CFC2|nr:response regulator transcription factor [Streptomyces sp. ACA25]MDB1089572.1 response regulator transcription factor [Streptomyces sp. ACA25]